MQKNIDRSLFDWQRGRTVGIQSRGLASLAAVQIKSATGDFTARGGTTSCVWPTSGKNADSRYLSKRIWGAR